MGSSTFFLREIGRSERIMYTFVALMLLAVANAEDKIIGGTAASSTSQSPWQVSLQQSGSHFCGASVISTTHIMSAGHCKITGAIARTTVALGGLDYRSLSQNFKVTSWVQHPQFTTTGIINYDYSVIKIDGEVQLQAGVVETITLPAAGQEFTGTATISGWGKIGGNINILPTSLQIVDLPLISDASCAAIWGARRITEQSVCVGGPTSSTGACNGDSGGPLFQEVNGVYYLIGNTSWGASSCDASEYPTIYSKNAAVADWIQQQMQ